MPLWDGTVMRGSRLAKVSWCVVGVLAHYGWPSHHPGGCCTLVVDEEMPLYYVKRFESLEKRYINVTNYYYYY